MTRDALDLEALAGRHRGWGEGHRAKGKGTGELFRRNTVKLTGGEIVEGVFLSQSLNSAKREIVFKAHARWKRFFRAYP
jgi:ribosomal protein S6E (S10)